MQKRKRREGGKEEAGRHNPSSLRIHNLIRETCTKSSAHTK